jgi:hypothetical protein
MRPATWVRFEQGGEVGFGRLEGNRILVHQGDLLDTPRATGTVLAMQAVRIIAPVRPGKVLALWNNFGQLAAKLGLSRPAEPLPLAWIRRP